MNPVLVYVDPSAEADLGVAWFCADPGVWGDDWDDAPWEHNAGRPYSWDARVIWYEGSWERPGQHELNSRWSVTDINAGAAPWLVTRWAGEDGRQTFAIPAGVTVEEFCQTMQRAGTRTFVVVNE